MDPENKPAKALSFESNPEEEYRLLFRQDLPPGIITGGKFDYLGGGRIKLMDEPTPAQEALALLSDPAVLENLKAIKSLNIARERDEQNAEKLTSRLAALESFLAESAKAAPEPAVVAADPVAPEHAKAPSEMSGKPAAEKEVAPEPSAPGGQRITFTLPNDAIDFLKKEATRTHQSMADIVRRAIANERYLREMSTGRRSLLVEEAGKPLTRLVFRD